jgi:putative ABC transport system ATP-binding protein
MMPVVHLADVSKSFGIQGQSTAVLRDVNLTIQPGTKSSLVGPSGGGKSTLLALIAGLLRPDKGAIEIDGIAMHDLDDAERARLRANRIGIALQSDNLVAFLTARENVELALAFAHRRNRREARARALELLDRFGVADRADHVPRHLSGGEAQRVALAVSIANDPALLLADEVVAQLDGDTAARVVDEVLTADFAVLFVTHDLALADLAEHRYELTDRGVHER